MKYFVSRHSLFRPDLVNETTPKTALELYKENAGSGFFNLKAVPNFQKGILIHGHFYRLWGEEVTDAECFRRKLEGTLLDGIWENEDD